MDLYACRVPGSLGDLGKYASRASAACHWRSTVASWENRGRVFFPQVKCESVQNAGQNPRTGTRGHLGTPQDSGAQKVDFFDAVYDPMRICVKETWCPRETPLFAPFCRPVFRDFFVQFFRNRLRAHVHLRQGIMVSQRDPSVRTFFRTLFLSFFRVFRFLTLSHIWPRFCHFHEKKRRSGTKKASF